jgi:hypothetical protein
MLRSCTARAGVRTWFVEEPAAAATARAAGNLAHNVISDTKWTNFEFGEKRPKNG